MLDVLKGFHGSTIEAPTRSVCGDRIANASSYGSRGSSQPDKEVAAVQTHESNVHLSPDEITLLVEALDSHEYWQLSESNERNDGYSTVEDGENEEIDAVRALMAKLERPRQYRPRGAPVAPQCCRTRSTSFA